MMFNLGKLTVANEDNLEVKRVWIRGGKFPHRLTRKEKDTRQCELRQKYLDHVPHGDWILILDSDEAIAGALKHIPLLLDLADDNNINVIMISELLPDFNVLLRPRLIRNKEGLKYGGKYMKHDYIEYEGTNYIDVNQDDLLIADFIYFNHYKNGHALQIFSKETIGADVNLPVQLVKLEATE